jgi:hypothetical protein
MHEIATQESSISDPLHEADTGTSIHSDPEYDSESGKSSTVRPDNSADPPTARQLEDVRHETALSQLEETSLTIVVLGSPPPAVTFGLLTVVHETPLNCSIRAEVESLFRGLDCPPTATHDALDTQSIPLKAPVSSGEEVTCQ